MGRIRRNCIPLTIKSLCFMNINSATFRVIMLTNKLLSIYLRPRDHGVCDVIESQTKTNMTDRERSERCQMVVWIGENRSISETLSVRMTIFLFFDSFGYFDGVIYYSIISMHTITEAYQSSFISLSVHVH